MKRLLSILIALVTALTMLAAFSVVIANTTEQNIIKVHNPKEFFKALKSDVTIKLLPGDYNMEKVPKTKYASYNKEPLGTYSVTGAMIKDLKNVKIIADENVLMYTSQQKRGMSDDVVLLLNNCSNVTFENITFGHKSKNKKIELSCIAGVLALYECENVQINHCDLFGCGFTGFNIENSNSITIRDSKIHDCVTSAFWMTECKDISFYNTEIYNNGINNTWNKLGETVVSTGTLLSCCNIHDNGSEVNLSGILFATYGLEQPILDRCILNNNKY